MTVDKNIDAASSLESQKAALSFALLFLRSLLLANGGAVLALLTFAGNFKGKEEIMPMLVTGIKFFITGLVVAIFCNICAYVTVEAQTLGHFKAFKIFRGVSVIIGLISLGLFAYGALLSANALNIF